MNKQDKKEIMNLIKYKKMLGGRRMYVDEAKQELSDICDIVRCGDYYSLENDDIEAIEVLLTELGRLSQENEELKQKINDFVEEMRCME